MSSRYSSRHSSGGSWINCGCYSIIFLFNLFLGGWSVNYILQFFLEKTVTWGWAMVIGLIGGEVTIPTALVIALLKWLGVI